MNKKMPIVRDVVVKSNAEDKPMTEAEEDNPLSNLMTITGFDKDDVIFRTRSAKVLQWRDADGELMAMLIRINSKLWGLCMRGDDDWDQMVAQVAHDDTDLLKGGKE